MYAFVHHILLRPLSMEVEKYLMHVKNLLYFKNNIRYSVNLGI